MPQSPRSGREEAVNGKTSDSAGVLNAVETVDRPVAKSFRDTSETIELSRDPPTPPFRLETTILPPPYRIFTSDTTKSPWEKQQPHTPHIPE